MLFNSPEFLFLFLPLACAVFVATARYAGGRWAHVSLIVASMGFYAYWHWPHLLLLLASAAANYALGRKIAAETSRRARKAGLAAGIALNLCLLGYFKYTNFAIENWNVIFGATIPYAEIILPLGISFYTFQKIGYLVDCYRGHVIDADPLRFAFFVFFFPQLIAGPIVHHSQIIPQLRAHEQSPIPRADQVARGLFLIILGLFKKVVIADNIAGIVNPIFANPSAIHFVDAWTGAIGFSLQLYFDFSAYSEMAMGLALLFGIVLPMNFNSPYKATSITDFWRRWHMTLGAFMRDYLYVPLGGNRNGPMRTARAALITMLIGGLWHGAAWTFVVWGAIHGAALVVHKAWRVTGRSLSNKAGLALTLCVVVFAWVPFKANSIGDSVAIWSKMLAIDGMVLPLRYSQLPLISSLPVEFAHTEITSGVEIFVLIGLMVFCFRASNVHEVWEVVRPRKRLAAGLSATSLVVTFSLAQPSTFMYFAF